MSRARLRLIRLDLGLITPRNEVFVGEMVQSIMRWHVWSWRLLVGAAGLSERRAEKPWMVALIVTLAVSANAEIGP